MGLADYVAFIGESRPGGPRVGAMDYSAQERE